MNVREYTHVIDGTEVPSTSKKWMFRESPASGLRVSQFAEGTTEDCQRAVSAARKAFDEGPWPKLSGQERSRYLSRLADKIEDRKEYLARIEVEEVGKPIRFARGDIEGAVSLTRYAAGLAWQMHGESVTNLGPNKTGLIVREPIGVVAAIIPWNFPGLIFAQKVPFALAAGCTTVAKPSEMTSGTAVEIARLALEVGIPAGVINVVTGFGDPVGEALSRAPDVDMICFTGSTRVGRRIIANSAETLKKVSLELGGKAANIVFPDADLDDALDGTLMGIFFNQGEVCCSGTRLVIHEEIADRFLEELVERAKSLRIGDPIDEASDLGAMISADHHSKVLQYISKGINEGAELLIGGDKVQREGYFIAPTILDKVTPEMTVYREEIFGPVLSVVRFKSDEDAVRIANDTSYGLSNAVWSKNVDTVLSLSGRLRSGTVWVNTIIDGAPQLPFGGYKASGFGREMGNAGFEEFTQVKTVLIHSGKRTPVFQ
jgi:acyl-CoA reductase-like NAD-dependent aldehyde dehydrogenase